jgi:NAD(P)-dependent dehydrogenase (short-subunit alcohol dehydrogenase family)/aryl carrier-like protein
VLAEDSQTAAELAHRIRAAGRRCYRVVRAGEAHGDDVSLIARGDGAGLRRLLERVEGPLAGIVQLEGCSTPAERAPLASAADAHASGLLELAAAHERGCGGLLELVQALHGSGWQRMPALWIATRGAQAVLAGPVRLGQAPLWGLARVLAVERPDLTCTRIDLDPEGPEDQSGHVFEELASGPSSDEIAWRDGTRYVQRLVRSRPQATTAVALDPQAAYLVTGGFGALGQRVAAWLADKGARHLVLVGRQLPEAPLPELERLIERGCRVQSVCLDVAQPGPVAALVRQLSLDGRALKGILHLAGALDDGALTEQSWPRFRQVMSSKVDGAFNLHHATRALELDCFVCFSSIASVLGSPAQGNYAAANAFLDALCHERRRQGRPALSVNWGPWAGAGMAASARLQDRERIANQGLSSLEPEQALSALDALWGDPAAQRMVARVDWAAFQGWADTGTLPPLLEAFASREQQPARRASLREELEAAPIQLRPRLLHKLVRSEVLQLLGSGQATRLGDRQGLAEAGLDSLQAIDLKNRLNRGLGVKLPSTLLFDQPSVQALTDYLAAHMTELFGVPAAEPASRPGAAALGELSEQQLLDLLSGELAAASAPERRS